MQSRTDRTGPAPPPQVAFFGPDAQSSANSYGYSPHSLSTYLSWLRPLLETKRPKQLVVSITGTPSETRSMLETLRAFAAQHEGVVVAVEHNVSCPNIVGHPPPAYYEEDLRTYLELLAEFASPQLKVGVKLPPYTYVRRSSSLWILSAR